MVDSTVQLLIGITFAAALVNGAIGYGFSSITVPLALLFISNRVLNPALVVIEVAVNLYVVFVNRRGLTAVARRVWPVLVGLLPAVVLGSLWLRSANPVWIKLATYAGLFPFIALQVAGFRRPIRAGRFASGVVGFGVGALYSSTTISGPPIALLLNNEGLEQGEFKASLGLIRTVESVATALTYVALGLVSDASVRLAGWVAPGVVVGVLLGHVVAKRLNAEVFRRACMGADLLLVSFGLSRVLIELGVQPVLAHAFFAAASLADALLLYRYFSERRRV